jgi:hypothetical protein
MTPEATDTEKSSGPGPSPYDTYASGSLRFLMELVAWIAGPWAAADLTGSGWTAIPVLVVLLALPSVFSTPGDKHQVIVATPGPVRLVIELILIAVAVTGAWIAWPAWLAAMTTVAALATLITGLPRTRWLLTDAPPVD